jgi:uncharacterized membrane protein HdeD (DUF308 family)
LRIAALVLGIVGGVFGLFAGFAAFSIGGLGSAFQADGAGTVVGLGLAAIFISVFGIVAGALALKYPKFSGWSQLISGILGIIAISAFYMIAGPILIIGGILALVSSRQAKGVSQNAA